MAFKGREIGAGASGGTIAGLLLSAMLLVQERATGQPNDIVRLGRKTAEKFGSPYRYNPARPALEEQAMSHGGHLVLSAAMGATYPAVRSLPGFRGAGGGLLFGAAFYPLLWGLLGPALGLTPTPREEGAATVMQRVGIHAAFGLVTALVTNALSPPPTRGVGPALP